jgi:hypothetical protein
MNNVVFCWRLDRPVSQNNRGICRTLEGAGLARSWEQIGSLDTVLSLLRRGCGGAVRPAIGHPSQSVAVGEVGRCVGTVAGGRRRGQLSFGARCSRRAGLQQCRSFVEMTVMMHTAAVLWQSVTVARRSSSLSRHGGGPGVCVSASGISTLVVLVVKLVEL